MTVKEGKPTNINPAIKNKLLIQSVLAKKYTNHDKIDIGEDSFGVLSGDVSLVDTIKKLKMALDKKNGIEVINPDDLYYSQIDE